MVNPNVVMEELDDGIWLLQSEEQGDGETVAVLGGVHPDEPAGIQVVKDIREMVDAGEFRLDRGNVVLMLGNLAVINENYPPGEVPHQWHVNMNRMFMRDNDPNAHLLPGTDDLSPKETYEYVARA